MRLSSIDCSADLGVGLCGNPYGRNGTFPSSMGRLIDYRHLNWLLLVVALSFPACTTFDVNTDHDPTADFDRFKTFAFAGLVAAEKAGSTTLR